MTDSIPDKTTVPCKQSDDTNLLTDVKPTVSRHGRLVKKPKLGLCWLGGLEVAHLLRLLKIAGSILDGVDRFSGCENRRHASPDYGACKR
ncbi:hypothetical protein TNCV_82571 [Trichonephila clavipes]|nr:hypothetical protein TNCV_82571 [Trichonephila clavipes]